MPPEIEAILRESPVAVAIVAVVGVAFLLVLLAAITSGSRGRKRRRRAAAVAAAERDAPYEAPEERYAPAPAYVAPAPRVRRGFGFAAVTVAFVLGLLAGMAAMTTLRHEIADGLSRLAVLVGVDPDAPGAPAVAPPTDGATVAPSAALDARLAAFVTSLRTSLPRPAGQELSLNSVEIAGTRLDLAYGVARVIPPDQMAAFRDYLDRTVRSLFCGSEETEVRYLLRNGIAFHMIYTDPAGAVISDVTVTNTFCG